VIGFPWIAGASEYLDLDAPVSIDAANLTPGWPKALAANIKVIGVGGAGGNAVEHMIREGLRGVEFICANADSRGLSRSSAPTEILLGPGSGTAGNSELASEFAINQRSRIAQVLTGADMIFVIAGMGGGTGTGAAPVFAELARKMGILTVAVVSTPFEFEGRRKDVAWKGMSELDRQVDALIVLPNERLFKFMDSDATMYEAFRFADQNVKNAVSCIANSVNAPGTINLDFEDVRLVLNGSGLCGMGSATFRGPDRARWAARSALYFPSMSCIQSAQRTSILFNVAANRTLGLKDAASVFRTLRKNSPEEATLLGSVAIDDSMGDKLRVTVIATTSGRLAPLKRIGHWRNIASGATTWL